MRSNRAADVAPAAAAAAARLPQPFFLSVGFFETHREFPAAGDGALHAPAGQPPRHAGDPRATWPPSRRAPVRSTPASEPCSTALPEDTLVILTTDHGLAFPGAKATLTDRGIGVLLIVARPWIHGRARLRRARLAARPLPDDLRAARHRTPRVAAREIAAERGQRRGVCGDHVPRRVRAAARGAHEALQVHTALRETCARQHRRQPQQGLPAGPRAWPSARRPPEAALRPRVRSRTRRATSSTPSREIAAELRARLQAWMEETGDPLLDGPVAPAPGTEYNTAGQRSPSEPTTRAR